MVKQISILQQMHTNQGQFIAGEPAYDPPKCCMHFILSMLLGSLLCGVPLAAVLTLYLTNQCCVSELTATSLSTMILTTQTPTINQTNSSAAVTTPYFCSDTSSYTLWQNYSSAGITMHIDTSSCHFNKTPLYFTSVDGIDLHWNLSGYTAIYSPTKDSFQVYAKPLTSWNSAQMVNYSQIYEWDVNWFGISN